MYRVIVAGSRSFGDYKLLEREMVSFLRGKYPKQVEIVSGTALGADRLGERFAIEQGCELEYFPANWEKYGKSAGYIRNSEMAKYADACVVFWDGKSRGAKHMIDIAERENLECKVIMF